MPGGLRMLKGKDGDEEIFGEQISNRTLIFATCLPAHTDRVCTFTGNRAAQRDSELPQVCIVQNASPGLPASTLAI